MSKPLELLIKSRNPLISIETIDEERAVALVRQVAFQQTHRVLYEWSLTAGLTVLHSETQTSPSVPGGKPLAALQHILGLDTEKAVFLFRDLGPFAKDAQVHRTIRDLIAKFAETQSTLILVDALPVPDELMRFAVRYEIGWPTAEELEAVVKQTYHQLRKESYDHITARMNRAEMDQLVQALRGLTTAQAARVVASAIFDDNELNADDLPRIIESKRTLLGSSGCLESIAADFSADDIGGLDNLKAWLKQRRGGFTPEAAKFGLEPPRGVLMLGIPGCGKSLCAKVVAADWTMPLLRLDPGVLFQKFIGESESQLRQALRQAEAMAPVILWIDEIEKAFASASAASADGGLSKRMFGTLLSWMQDHRHPIFIIATANDISALPPELMRKGRFDEVFFVDLPKAEDRAGILEIHLRRRKRDPAQFDLKRVSEACDGFSGSELEQVVVSALFAAFSEKSELQDKHLLQEIQKTRPLSVLNREKILDLRTWAANRCVPAD